MRNHSLYNPEDSLRRFFKLNDSDQLVFSELEKAGFQCVAKSGRYLVKHLETNRYFKLAGRRYEHENLIEAKYWLKLRTASYSDYFTSTVLIWDTVVEVEFAEGKKLIDCDCLTKHKVFSKVNRLIKYVYDDFGIRLEDIHDQNIMYNPEDKTWKIFDYGGNNF